MCWLPKLFGKRVVVTIHGLDPQTGRKWGKFAGNISYLAKEMPFVMRMRSSF